jgi:hypothetical protein
VIVHAAMEAFIHPVVRCQVDRAKLLAAVDHPQIMMGICGWVPLPKMMGRGELILSPSAFADQSSWFIYRGGE